MPVGLQVKNDDGYLQIDENYRNFTVKTSGTGTTGVTSIGGTNPIYVSQITATTCTFPMISIRSTSSYVSVIGTEVNGSTYTFSVASNSSSTSFNYWIFDVATPPVDTFGLEIYNSNGDLVFHSSNKAMRIVTSYDAGDGDTSGNTLASGRTYAVIQGSNGFRSRNVFRPLPNNYLYISYCAGHKWDGTTLYIPYPTIALTMPSSAPLKIDQIQPSGETTDYIYTPQIPKFVVVDVTNF